MIVFRIVYTVIYVSLLLLLLIKKKKKRLIFWLSMAYVFSILTGEVIDQLLRNEIESKMNIEEIFKLGDLQFVAVIIQAALLLCLTIYAFIKELRNQRKGLESQDADY